MVGIDDFSRIVSAIYASALNPENWIVAMADIRRALDAQSAALLLADGTSRSLTSGSLPPEAQRTYVDYYRQIDYALDAVEEGPVGLIRSGQPLIALKARSEFDADWMRPHQMDDGLFVRLTIGSMPTCWLPHPPRRRPNLIRVNTPDDLVNRHFTAARPNELWCTDITEHPARDGKVYCCAILDCFSRMIVARTFSTTPDTALVNNAVNMAVANRNRCGSTIVHADHGTQFTSWSFGENVRRWGCSPPLAPSATAMTTPPWNPSGPGCKSSYSTPVNGRPP